LSYYLTARDKADKISAKLKQIGSLEPFIVKADITKRSEVSSMVRNIKRKYGKIDVLINIAGGVFNPSDWKSISESDWEKTVDLNLKGYFECTRAFGFEMVKQKHGTIVNIAGSTGIFGHPDYIAYAAASAGVINLTQSFAKRLAPNININTILLGWVNLGSGKILDEKIVKIKSEQNLIPRPGSGEDVLNAILFFTSEKSKFITGRHLLVNGGTDLKD
jgi:3-oxoacyl-[acyl-carrier protein] reductase